MTKRNHQMFRTTLLFAALSYAIGWSDNTFAQTATAPLKAPTAPGATLKTTPLTTQSPLTATPAVQPNAVTTQSITKPATTAVIKKNVLQKATVMAGVAALSMSQKVAAAAAFLAEEQKEAKERQDKQSETAIALLLQNLSVSNGATLALASPKASWGNAHLSLIKAYQVDFDKGTVQFTPSLTNQNNALLGYPMAQCVFNAPEEGYYLVAFSIQGAQSKTVASISFNQSAFSAGTSAKVVLNSGENIVTLVEKFSKGGFAFAGVTSEDNFGFKSCEISRIK